MTNKVQGGDYRGRRQGRPDGRRSQGEDRRDLEQEEPGGTQAAAMKATHGGVDGGKSHGGGRSADSRGPTDGGGARDREPMSQGNGEDLEGQGGDGATEEQGGDGGKEVPDRAGGVEWLWAGLCVRSGAGVVVCKVRGEQWFAGHHHPINEGSEALSRTLPGQLRSCGSVKSSMIEWAEAVVRVVCEVGEEHKVFSVILKRVVPLLQQEDEDGRVIQNKKKNFQSRK